MCLVAKYLKGKDIPTLGNQLPSLWKIYLEDGFRIKIGPDVRNIKLPAQVIVSLVQHSFFEVFKDQGEIVWDGDAFGVYYGIWLTSGY
ncbi:hypothetical protein RIF29_21602 [Crotalaria pallida]|uniref:Uncharacterized protein n=1 Tax=Crotalaria pallida TaxID=3830 RepID=A0AAN9FBT6_CROPI